MRVCSRNFMTASAPSSLAWRSSALAGRYSAAAGLVSTTAVSLRSLTTPLPAATRGFKISAGTWTWNWRATPVSRRFSPLRRADEGPSSSGTGGAASTSSSSTAPPPPPGGSRPPVAPITWKSALLALGACGVVLAYFELEKAKRTPKIELAVVGTPSIGGPFTLVDQEGRVVTNHTFHGRYMLLYFGFTFCPDICPAELAKVTKSLRILEEEEGITPGLVVPVFVSVDPYRDTVAKIRTYLKDFHPSFVGLTGTPQQVESMARAFRVYSTTSQHSEEDEDYLVDHSIFLYLLDKEGNFLSHHGSQYDARALAKRIADDVRAKGDCPPPLWRQIKDKASEFARNFIH